MGRTVRGQDDLLVVFVQGIEGVEEFFLGGVLTGNKLYIVHQKQICIAVFGAEFYVVTFLHGLDQFIGELVALDVDDIFC